MKKILYFLVIILFFSQDSYSQEYTFDNYYEYNSDNGTKFFMTNSGNENYLFFGYTGNQTIYGYIVDFNSNEYHYFDVENTNDSVSFTYTYSKKITECSCDIEEKNVTYTYSVESIDSLKSKTIVNKIKIKKNGKIKPIAKLELSYQNDETYIFYPSHLNFYLHHFHITNELIGIKNKLPLKIDVFYNNERTFTSSLSKRKKINTLLTISKEQIKYSE